MKIVFEAWEVEMYYICIILTTIYAILFFVTIGLGNFIF